MNVLILQAVFESEFIRKVFFFMGRIFVIWLQNKKNPMRLTQTTGVSHCGLAIYIKKYLKSTEELWKLKYFTMPKYNLLKIL
jgi:hypothetical protein